MNGTDFVVDGGMTKVCFLQLQEIDCSSGCLEVQMLKSEIGLCHT